MKLFSLILLSIVIGSAFTHGKYVSKGDAPTLANPGKDGVMDADWGKATKDDWNEKTDVKRERQVEQTKKVDYEPSYQAGKDEVVLKCWEETDKIDPVTTTCVEVESTILPDGRLVNRTITRQVTINHSIKVKEIKKFWTKKYNLLSVTSLIAGFTKKYAQELTDNELALFNSIAVTDGNEFESNYNYVQAEEKYLDVVLRKVLKVFKTPLCEDDIKYLLNEIKECKKEAVVRLLDTRSIEVDREDSWTVCLEVFFATCGKEIPAVQLFAWSGCKSGAYHKGLCSKPNRATVDTIITKWLARQIYLLFTCKDVPVKKPCIEETTKKREETRTHTETEGHGHKML